MYLFEAISLAQMQLGKELTKKNVAEALGITKNYLYQIDKKPLSLEHLEKLEKVWDVSLVNNATAGAQTFKIPYWSHSNCCDFKIMKSALSFCNVDAELIVEWGVNPDALRVIAMPGEEMNAGIYPLRNRDILIVDTSSTDISNSGIYFCTTHNNTRVYVRRILEVMDTINVMYTSVDNPLYKHISRYWTREEIKAADVRVIGRVIKNMSFLI